MVEGSWPRIMIKEPIGNTQLVGGHMLPDKSPELADISAQSLKSSLGVLLLEGSYFSLVLDPPQKLFCSPGTSYQKLFPPRRDTVDLAASPAFRLPNGLQVAFFLHCMQQ